MVETKGEPDNRLERVRSRWQSDPYVRLLGLEIVSFEPGRALLRLPLNENVLNAGRGAPHGGALCSAMDIAIGIALNAANATAGEGSLGQTTTDISVSFLAGAGEGPLAIEAEIIRRGRTLAVGEATVRDAKGAAVAVGRATFMIVRPDQQRIENG